MIWYYLLTIPCLSLFGCKTKTDAILAFSKVWCFPGPWMDWFQGTFPCFIQEKLVTASANPWSKRRIQNLSGWWFQTFFSFHNIWDNPSHWRTPMFQGGFSTTNQHVINPMPYTSIWGWLKAHQPVMVVSKYPKVPWRKSRAYHYPLILSSCSSSRCGLHLSQRPFRSFRRNWITLGLSHGLTRPGKRSQKTMERSTDPPVFMGKSTISIFSMAIFNSELWMFTRG